MTRWRSDLMLTTRRVVSSPKLPLPHGSAGATVLAGPCRCDRDAVDTVDRVDGFDAAQRTDHGTEDFPPLVSALPSGRCSER